MPIVPTIRGYAPVFTGHLVPLCATCRVAYLLYRPTKPGPVFAERTRIPAVCLKCGRTRVLRLVMEDPPKRRMKR